MTTKEIAEELLDYYRQMEWNESLALNDLMEDVMGDELKEYAVTVVHQSMQDNKIYDKYQEYILEHHTRFIDNLKNIGFSDMNQPLMT